MNATKTRMPADVVVPTYAFAPNAPESYCYTGIRPSLSLWRRSWTEGQRPGMTMRRECNLAGEPIADGHALSLQAEE